jgi:GT2 family glycosyltransferase
MKSHADLKRSPLNITALLPVHNRVSETITCLSRLLAYEDESLRLRVVLVDDGSTDGTASKIRRLFPMVKILPGNGNLWWAGGVNRGLKYIAASVDCDFILVLNNDTAFTRSTLFELLRHLQPGSRTVLSAVTIDTESGRIYSAGQRLRGPLQKLEPVYKGAHPDAHRDEMVECDSVGTRFLIMPKRIIGDVGYFDQRRFPHGYSDFEYFLRARKSGYRVIVNTGSKVYTQQNRNYMNYLLVEAKLTNYIATFFDRKYENYLKLTFYRSFTHKNILLGILSFAAALLSQTRWIMLKLLLPRDRLKRVILTKWVLTE